MPAKVLTIDGLPAEMRAVGQQLGRAAVKALRAAAVDIQREAILQVQAVKPFVPVNNGEMLRGFERGVRYTPDGAIVENTVPHAAHMEYGTRPFTPPIKPLRLWAARKLKIPLSVAVDMNRGFLVKGQQGPRRQFKRSDETRAIDALAFGARRSIQRVGIRGRGFWRATMAKAPEIIDRRLTEATKAVT